MSSLKSPDAASPSVSEDEVPYCQEQLFQVQISDYHALSPAHSRGKAL